jgi:hypothetical protein
MSSPVPKHLREFREVKSAIPSRLLDHVDDLVVDSKRKSLSSSHHPAKYSPGLPTALVALAGTSSIGDPFAGTGRIAEETEIPAALNELDKKWSEFLFSLASRFGCEVSIGDARKVPWRREVLIFSPPYYPRTDRRRLAAHDDERRGPVVGYRSGYGGSEIEGFIGDPSGCDGILHYRDSMREVYRALLSVGRRMIVVVKNQTRLGVELRLDHDTILTAQEAGWRCVERHGWSPPPSLWARYNLSRSTGVKIEDVLVFDGK